MAGMAGMRDNRRKLRLGDMLLDEGIITEEQLMDALTKKQTSDKKLGEILVSSGYTTEENIAKALSEQLGYEMVSLNTVSIEDNVLRLVDASVLRKYQMLPIGYSPSNMNEIRVAMVDPMDMRAIDDFSIITNLQVIPVITTSQDMIIALDRFYGNSEAARVAEQYAAERKAKTEAQQVVDLKEEDNVSSSPIVMLVNSIVEQAARQRASDIHIEALENRVRVRYRIDGALYEKGSYDNQLLGAIVARIKIVSGMDISEKRKPQDGRMTLDVDHVEYDIRVSMLPTVYGEKCVMRLAQKKALTRDKRELGFDQHELELFDEMLSHPNGIILVTGPTGSGKSTTLYTALSELNKEDVNIITVEDPVEANIVGINQVHVNAKAELTFAAALRSILRQDPDIIMIGEIRDEETAGIAVTASITGHLVVSTLHTNSASDTINRLINMGIESYLLADSLVGVIAQRLVRRLCPECKRAKKPDEFERKMLRLKEDEDVTIYEPVGCPRCSQTGFRGRIGIYEILKVTPRMKTMITNEASAEDIKKAAIEEGMNTLTMGVRKKVLEGITAVSEMIGVSAEE